MALFSYQRLGQATVFVFGLALGACASVPHASRAARPVQSAQPLARIAVAPDTRERDLLVDLIGGELALAGTDATSAAIRYADAANASDDPLVAEQATHIAIAARQWDLARAALGRWQALKGEEVGIRQSRAMLEQHDENADGAFADLLWLAHQPEGSGWRPVAQALLGAENKLAAGALLERVLTEGASAGAAQTNQFDLGSKSETWIAVSQLALRLDRRDLSRTLADQAVNRFHSAEVYAWAAQLRLGDGDKAGARKLFADALRSDKAGSSKTAVAGKGGDQNRRLRIAYATLLGDIGENDDAARVLAEGPQDDFTFGARAAYLARSEKEVNKALVEALFKEALASPGPRSPARIQLLGQLSELLEHKAEALKWYAQVPRDDDHWFDAQMRTAVIYADTGKTADAYALLHELQARTGDDVKSLGEAFLLEAELLSRGKRGEEALVVYARGLQALPDDTRLLYARALLNDDLDHVDAAITDLRRMLEIKPDDADAMNALGYTLADRTDRKTEALALIERALKLKPGEPAIMDSLGWVQYRLGNLDAAIAQLRGAYVKQPDPEIAAHLGEVLWVSGRKDEARQIWDQGRKKDAANKLLLDTIKRLAS